MTKKLELYRCEMCGNLVEVVLEGVGELICCGEPMKPVEAQKEETMAEKHVPVFEKTEDNGLLVKIGSVPHPMTEEHFIQFIEVCSKDKKYIKRKYLNPNEAAELKLKCLDIDSLTAIEFCNIHGLWEANYD